MREKSFCSCRDFYVYVDNNISIEIENRFEKHKKTVAGHAMGMMIEFILFICIYSYLERSDVKLSAHFDIIKSYFTY